MNDEKFGLNESPMTIKKGEDIKSGETDIMPLEPDSLTFININEEEREKAVKVINEIKAIKDEMIRLDNTDVDFDRKRGTVEVFGTTRLPGRKIIGEVEFDDYSEGKELLFMNLGVFTDQTPPTEELKKSSASATDETDYDYQFTEIRDPDDKLVTKIYSRYNKKDGLLQTAYVDTKTGQMFYKETIQ